MSNTNASEENTESPSTYGNEGYKEFFFSSIDEDLTTHEG
jgi:hypothetical protein